MSMVPPAQTGRASTAARWRLSLAVAVIAFTAFMAYRGSLNAPFVFDDQLAIVENQTIRDLRSVGEVLNAATPSGAGVRGRPLINLSMALNYAAGGMDVRGYHWFNLAVHVLAGLVLFGLVRRTLDSDRCRAWLGGEISSSERPLVGAGKARAGGLDGTAFLLAFVVTLLWLLHPLQSETVICTAQRTESLMGLFYLLTLYLVVRGSASTRAGGWFGAAVAACLAGMACKEVMVSAPLIVLLYDRTFLCGSFREALRRRRLLYLGLAATWGLLGFLVIHSGGQRGGTVGFGLGISTWDYALTQCRAVLLYLRLSVWPHPLNADYGTALVTRLVDVLPQALVLAALAIGTAVALVRRPFLGFVGAWFFVILAPSSSVLPLATQTIAEHRMYLPLAAVIVLAVVAVHRACGRPGLVALLGLAAAFGGMTILRGDVYRSEFGFWSEVVVRQPDNPRAHYNLGCLLVRAGRGMEGMSQLEEAVRLRPDFAEAHLNLGHALNRAGRTLEAIQHYEEAVRLKPENAPAHNALGGTLERIGRTAEAVAEYEQVLRLRPGDASARAGIERARATSTGAPAR